VAPSSLPDRPAILWRYRTEGEIRNPPVAGGGRLFVVDGKGTVHALDLSGKRIWSRTLEEGIRGGERVREKFLAPPLYAGGNLLLASNGGTLHALVADSGRTRWKYRVGAPVLGAPARVDAGGATGVVVLTQPDGTLHRVDLGTGKAAWISRRTNRADGSPAADGKRIAFGNCDAALHIVSSDRGEKIGQVGLGPEGEAYAGVAIADGQAFLGVRGGRILAIDLTAGRILWEGGGARGAVSSTPAVDAQRVVYASDDGFVSCVDRRTGKEIWTAGTGDRPLSPVIAGDKVAVSSGGTVLLLRLADGKTVWSRAVGDHLSAPAVVRGMLLVGTDEGHLVALGTAGAGNGGRP
jgi:outer membrane protein assembly factor BamB